MDKLIEALPGLLTTLLIYLTAKVTLAKEKNTQDSTMTKTSFDSVVKRLDAAEAELKEYRDIKAGYSALKEKYKALKEKYDSLQEEYTTVKARVAQLEKKEGIS